LADGRTDGRTDDQLRKVRKEESRLKDRTVLEDRLSQPVKMELGASSPLVTLIADVARPGWGGVLQMCVKELRVNGR
jgi:hypothetical protein